MVYAKSTEVDCVALVVVNPGPIKKLAESLGMGGKSVKQLYAEPAIAAEVQKECAKLANRVEREIPKKVTLDACGTLDAGERRGHRRLQAQARQHLQGVRSGAIDGLYKK